MLVRTYLVILLTSFSAFNQNTNPPFFTNAVDLGVLVLPRKHGMLEYLSLGFQHKVKERLMISGLLLSQNTSEDVFVKVNNTESQFGFGISYQLLKDRRGYFNPFIHAFYNYYFYSLFDETYRGGGFQAGGRIGFRMKKFDLGIIALSGVSYGRWNRPNFPIPKVNIYHWTVWNGGINLIYKL